MLALCWLLIGVGFAGSAGDRPEILDLPDSVRAMFWIAPAYIAAVSAHLPRCSYFALVVLTLPVSERIVSLLSAWAEGTDPTAIVPVAVYVTTMIAVVAVAHLPDHRDCVEAES